MQKLWQWTAVAAVIAASPSLAATTGLNGGVTTGSNSGASMSSTTNNTSNSGANNNGAANSSGATGTTMSDASNNNSWSAQNSYWRDNYTARPYYSNSRDYSAYEPAYHYGVDMYNKNPNLSYDQLSQSQLQSGWNTARGNSSLGWNDAQVATRDAYNRMYQSNGANGSKSTAGASSTTNTMSNYSPSAR